MKNEIMESFMKLLLKFLSKQEKKLMCDYLLCANGMAHLSFLSKNVKSNKK